MLILASHSKAKLVAWFLLPGGDPAIFHRFTAIAQDNQSIPPLKRCGILFSTLVAFGLK